MLMIEKVDQLTINQPVKGSIQVVNIEKVVEDSKVVEEVSTEVSNKVQNDFLIFLKTKVLDNDSI